MTQKRMAFMKELMNFIGIHPDRLNVTWVSSSEAPQFAEGVTAFVNRLRELGPSPLKRVMAGISASVMAREAR